MLFGGNKKTKIINAILLFSLLFILFLFKPDIAEAVDEIDVTMANRVISMENSVSFLEENIDICFPGGTETRSDQCPDRIKFSNKESALSEIEDTKRMIETEKETIDNPELLSDLRELSNFNTTINNAEETINLCFPDNTETRSEQCPDSFGLTRETALNLVESQRDQKNALEQQISDKYGPSVGQLASQGIADGAKKVFGAGKDLVDAGKEKLAGLGPLGIAGGILEWLAEIFGTLITQFLGIGLRISGLILDYVVNNFVIGMGSFVEGNEAIKISWEIVRDIINILFIFGLLYISIQTIISGIGPKTKTLLAGLIAAALLINFSYFITTVLIDASNFFAVETYKQLGTCADAEGLNALEEVLASLDGGLSHCFMDKLNITTTLTSEDAGYGKALAGDADLGIFGEITLIIMGSIFIIILSWVFLALALMLTIRFIVLVFLLITSPVMFLGWVLPNFSGLSKNWFSKLTQNLLYAPLVFLFLLITLSIADQLSNIPSGVRTGSGVMDTSIHIVVSFIVIIGFTIASLQISSKLGASGASFATAKAGGLVFGSTARLGRNTLGRGAAAWSQNIKGTGAGSVAARNVLKSIGNKSFDARGSKTFSGVASATGITAGNAETKGFTELRDAKNKKLDAEYNEVGNLTRGEKAKERELLEKINSEGHPVHKKMEERKKAKKDIEEQRQELIDSQNRMKTLDKESKEYKNLEKETGKIADKIEDSKKSIKKINEEIKNNSDIKDIGKLRAAGKERQKQYLAQRTANNWYSPITPSTREAVRQIREEARNKDDQKEDLDKLIKDSGDKKDNVMGFRGKKYVNGKRVN